MSLRKTTEQLLKEFATRRPERAGLDDYSQVDYRGARTHVLIRCSKHNFTYPVTPDNYLRGRGCRMCRSDRVSAVKRKGLKEFLKLAPAMRPDRVSLDDFSGTRITKFGDEMEVLCKRHGSYTTTPTRYLYQNHDCPTCSNQRKARKLSQQEFLRRLSQNPHVAAGRLRATSATKYVSGQHKTTVACPVHGPVVIAAAHLLKGGGCGKCATSAKLTPEGFLARARIKNQVLGGMDSFENAVYKNSRTKVTFTCSLHGDYLASPRGYLQQGKRCPRCATKISHKEVACLNELGLPNDPEHRQVRFGRYEVDGFDPEMGTVYEFLGDFFHGNPVRYPPSDQNLFLKQSFGALYQKTFSRFDSILKGNPVRVSRIVYVWESDWDAFVSCDSDTLQQQEYNVQSSDKNT